MRFTIGMYVDGAPFTGQPLERQAIGGAESAAWSMAEALQARGHWVTVFCRCDAAHVTESGVRYQPIQVLQTAHPVAAFDVWIVQRNHLALALPVQSRVTWFWAHDVPANDTDQQINYLGVYADRALVLSDFHRELMDELKPKRCRAEVWESRAADLFWTTRNGIDFQRIRQAISGLKRNPKQLIYCARPERGLDLLLMSIWPKLHLYDPQLTLHVCSYSWGPGSGHLEPHVARYYQDLAALAGATPGVVFHRALPKGNYWKILATSALCLYPTAYPEISCIQALEAQACGTPMVTTHDFALTETLPYQGIQTVLPPSEEYVTAFVARTIELLKNDVQRRLLADMGNRHVQMSYQWKDIAEEWEREVERTLELRAARRPYRILETLVERGAIITAHAETLSTVHDLGEWDQERYETIRTRIEAQIARAQSLKTQPGRVAMMRLQGWEADATSRGELVRLLPPARPGTQLRVLQVGAGEGALLATLLRMRPDAVMTAIEPQPSPRARMAAFVAEQQLEERVRILDGTETGAPGEHAFDAVIVSDLMAVALDPPTMIAGAEQCCRKGGVLIFEIPVGPWEHDRPVSQRCFLQSYDEGELHALFGRKQDLVVRRQPFGMTPRGEMLGTWRISYVYDPTAPTGAIDPGRRLMIERPRERIVAVLAVKDGERTLLNCLQAARPYVDAVVISVDDRTTDETVAVIERFAQLHPELPVTHRMFTFEDFGQARNIMIQGIPDADWILWLDADEELVNGQFLSRYCESGFWTGYAIRQQHFVVDAPEHPKFDIPIRLFRAQQGYTFVGCIHEDLVEPATYGREFDVNREIQPTLVIAEADLLHMGFTSEAVRRQKASQRNMPLLLKDRRVNPTRLKGALLVLREEMNLASWDLQQRQGEATPKTLDLIRSACRIYRQAFASPDAPWHEHAYPIYQAALQFLARRGLELDEGKGPPFEARFGAMVARAGFSAGAPELERSQQWFASLDEFREHLDFQVRAMELTVRGKSRRRRLSPGTMTNGHAEDPHANRPHEESAPADAGTDQAIG